MISKIKADAFHIDAAEPILRSIDYQRFLTARQIVEAAQQDADTIRRQAKQAYDLACERGYQEGLKQAHHDLIKRHIDFVAKAIQFTAQLEHEIIGLIKAMLTKITDQMDVDDLTKAIVAKTLAEYGTMPELKLQAAPQQKEMIEQFLSTLAKKDGRAASVKFVTVEADEHLQPGECILESPIGSVDASLDVQLNALKEVLDRAPHKNIELKKET